MPSTWWSLAHLACLSTCMGGNNSPSVKQLKTLLPATLSKCYFVYHAFFSLWTHLDGLIKMLRFHRVFHCPVGANMVKPKILQQKKKNGSEQSNRYIVQQIVASLESSFLLDVV